MLFDALRENDSDKFLQFVNTPEWLTTEQILSSSLDAPQAPGKIIPNFHLSNHRIFQVDDAMEGVDDELRMAIERSLRET